MSELFLCFVNMSISAGWVVLAVLLLRLMLKKAPKWISVSLWGIVAIRLICPFSFESAVSLIPSAQTINPEFLLNQPAIDSGVEGIDNVINPIIAQTAITVQPEKDINLFGFILPYLAGLWLVGIVALLTYTLISYLRVKNRIGTAVLLRDNIFQSEKVVSPFVLGFIKPKIYLPFDMNGQSMEYVIAHENAHIRRKDHLWKPIGFLLLTLHWFNPLMWIGYILLCKDIELACDEKVIKEFDVEKKADYSQALLTCSVNRRMIAACPLAFGEVGVKDRVKSVLNYKKPTFWIIVVAIALSVIVAVCFLTNPMSTKLSDELSVFIDMQIAEHNYSEEHTGDNFITASYKVLGVDKSLNETTVYMWVMYEEYSFADGKIKLESGSHLPTVITAKHTGEHGHYELIEYWTPRDGSLYADDIRGKFPWYLHGKALDSQRYVDEQKEFCQNAAEEYFREEAEKEATELSRLLEQLEQTHPHFFSVPTEGGLTVYVWEMAKGIYECHLANTARESITDQSFVYTIGAVTVEEMKAILTTYDVDRKDITIQPVINPWSSYIYEIDEAYTAKIKALFGVEENPTVDTYDGSSIPKLMVTCDGATTQAVMGTTTWTYDLGNGMMQSISGDSSHPLAMLENYLLPNALQVNRALFPESYVELKFELIPDSIKVNAWFITDDGSANPFDAEVKGMKIKLNECTETCVYEIVATYNSNPKYNGIVSHSFAVLEKSNIPYDEWGLNMGIRFISDTEFEIVFDHNKKFMAEAGILTISPEYEIRGYYNGEAIPFETYMGTLGVKYEAKQFAWDTVLYTIPENKETAYKENLAVTYGSLPVGEYVLLKSVYFETESGDRLAKVYTERFAIVN